MMSLSGQRFVEKENSMQIKNVIYIPWTKYKDTHLIFL